MPKYLPDPFGLLTAYVRREGHARVPAQHVERGINLGSWVFRQREAFRRGLLPASDARKLARLPRWSWNPSADAFAEGLRNLKRYADREGHAFPPQGHVERSFALGVWVANRREDRVRGRLPLERLRALEALPGWRWRAGRNATFWRGFHVLEDWVRREGHGRVPKHHRESGLALGHWVIDRRREHNRGRLSRDKIKRLEALAGWTWSPYDDAFQRGLALLWRYVKREEDALVNWKHVERGFPLGRWVAVKRNQYRLRGLSRDKVSALAAVPGWAWNGREGRKRAKQELRRNGLKRCSRCTATLPIAQFNRNAWQRDGLASWCQGCSAAYKRTAKRRPSRAGRGSARR